MRKLRPNVKKEDFFFNQKEKKVFLLVVRTGAIVVGACLVLLILIGGITSSLRTVARGGEVIAEQAASPPPLDFEEPEAKIPRLTLSDFMLSGDSERLLEPEITLFRERTGRWDEELINRFWVPPARIGLEKLRELNDKNIERLFEDVK